MASRVDSSGDELKAKVSCLKSGKMESPYAEGSRTDTAAIRIETRRLGNSLLENERTVPFNQRPAPINDGFVGVMRGL